MKKVSLIVFVLFVYCQIFAQTKVINLRVHIFGTNNGELRLSVRQTEELIKKIQEDYDGTTGVNSIGNTGNHPQSYYDTHIRFNPEIIIHDDDALLRKEIGFLYNLFGNNNYLNIYINFNGAYTSTGMVKGIGSYGTSCWIGTYSAYNNDMNKEWTTTHEIGHCLGLGHACFTGCDSLFMNPGQDTWIQPYPGSFQFTEDQIITMNDGLDGFLNTIVTIANPLPILPTADFDVDKKDVDISQIVNFKDLSTSTAVSWFWDFGDGITSADKNPIHSYTTPGVYDVRLVVQSQDGNADTMIRKNLIHVDPPPLSLPYYEGFDDPDFYSGTTWFIEDSARYDYVTFKYGNENYNHNQISAIGNYFINCEETTPYTSPTGLPGTEGALMLDNMNTWKGSWYENTISVYSPNFNFSGSCLPTLSFSLSHIPFSIDNPNICNCRPNYLQNFPYTCCTAPQELPNISEVCSPDSCFGKSVFQLDRCTNERLELQYSINPGIWVTLYDKTKDQLLTVPGEACSYYSFAPLSTNWWRKEIVTLPNSLIGQPKVKFRFRYTQAEGMNTLLIDDVKISIEPDVKINTFIVPTCLQNNGMLEAIVDSGTATVPYTYLWNTGSTNNTVNGLGAGIYVLSVTDANGCVGRDTLDLLASSTLMSIDLGNDTALCNNAPITLNAYHQDAVSYIWSGAGIDGLTDSSITFIPNQTGNYSVRLTDINGCITFDTIQITVSNFSISLCCDGSSLLPGCPSYSLRLITPSYDITSYTWYELGNPVPVGGNMRYMPTASGTYVLRAVNPYGCISYDTTSVTLAQPGQNWPAPVTHICRGDSVLLDASSPFYSNNPVFTWSGPDIDLSGPEDSIYVHLPGTYQVNVTHGAFWNCYYTFNVDIVVDTLPVVSFNGLPNTICELDPIITLMGSPAGGIFSGTGITGNTFDPRIAGIGIHPIIYTYTNSNGCTSRDTQYITVNPLPIVSFSGLPVNVCKSAPAFTLIGSPSGGTFSGVGVVGNTFVPNISGVGTFTVTYTYTDINGCTNATTQQVTVYALVVSFSGLPVSICKNAAAVTLTGLPAGGIFTGAGITGNLFTPSQAGVGLHAITYTYTDVNGCSNSRTSYVNVLSIPVVTAIANPSIICYGDVTAFSQLTASGAQSYIWSPSNTLNNASIANPQARPTTTTTYTVTGTGANGCSNTAMVTVQVQPPPFDLGPDMLVCMNTQLVLGSMVYNSPPYIYTWYTVSGNIATPIPGATTSTLNVTTNWAPNIAGKTFRLCVKHPVSGCIYCDQITITTQKPCNRIPVNTNKDIGRVDFEIYPNPSNGNFTIQFNQALESDKNIGIQIFDQLGQLMYSRQILETDINSFDIALDNIAKGIYFINITGTKNYGTQKIMVK